MSNLLLMTDLYKYGHHMQYPAGTTKIHSYMSARGSRIPGADFIVFFGLQYYLREYFSKVISETDLQEYADYVTVTLGSQAVDMDKFAKLVGKRWPVKICAYPEGAKVAVQVPFLTIENTEPEFYWATNFVETLLSKLWFPCTTATIAHLFRRLSNSFAAQTCENDALCSWQMHDFSYRSISSEESARLSGAAHLLNFSGTDTMGALPFLKKYYDAKLEGLAGSVPATEHSVMCAHGKENEFETFGKLLDLYPNGIVSIVSDTWDYWNVINNFAPRLKDKIEARYGKLVFRPDSSPKTPLEIICGDPQMPSGTDEWMGTLNLLWGHFGGTINKKGFRELNPQVGVIYGDSISLEMAAKIFGQMKEMGYASNNVVFGIGGVNYQWISRDTFNFAIKASYAEFSDGTTRDLKKEPKTGKNKTSLTGRQSVPDFVPESFEVIKARNLENISIDLGL